ncbi:globin domain-containing protein, putative, partial [Bodo saltans]
MSLHGTKKEEMDSKLQYINQHKLHVLIDELIVSVVNEMPDDPAAFMAQLVMAKRKQILDEEQQRAAAAAVAAPEPVPPTTGSASDRRRPILSAAAHQAAPLPASSRFSTSDKALHQFWAIVEKRKPLIRQNISSKLSGMDFTPETIEGTLANIADAAFVFPEAPRRVFDAAIRKLDLRRADTVHVWHTVAEIIRDAAFDASHEEVDAWNQFEATVSRLVEEVLVTVSSNELVQTSWSWVAHDMVGLGDMFYDQLFMIDSEIEHTLFAGTDMKRQAVRVMEMIDAAVQGLNTPETIAEVMFTSGLRHAAYGVQRDHYTVVGKALIAALKAFLARRFTPEVAQAWSVFYNGVQRRMLEGSESPKGIQMRDEFLRRPKRISDKRRIEDSWVVLSYEDDFGGAFYRNLLRLAPHLKSTIFKNTDMAKQGRKLFETVNLLVSLLGDHVGLQRAIVSLGERHARAGVDKDDIDMGAPALISALREVLGPRYKQELETAWSRFYEVIADKMKIGYSTLEGVRAAQASMREASSGPSDMEMIAKSWAYVSGNLEAFGEQFYHNLFKADDTLRDNIFFGTDIKRQSLAVMESIDRCVHAYDDTPPLASVDQELRDVGTRHTRYGVNEWHYPIVRSALLETLKENLESRGLWLPAYREPWNRFYASMQQRMLAGSNTAPGRLRRNTSRAQLINRLVQYSWAHVSGNLQAVGDLFYSKLFFLKRSKRTSSHAASGFLHTANLGIASTHPCNNVCLRVPTLHPAAYVATRLAHSSSIALSNTAGHMFLATCRR